MIRTVKTRFRATKDDMNRLFECNRVSANVWNDCLAYSKEHNLATGHWITLSELQRLTRRKYKLHSQSIQSVQERYIQARTNAWEAKQKGFTEIRYPYKEKKNYPTRWKKDGFRICPDRHIELSMCIFEGKRQSPITVKVPRIPQGKIKEIELIWDRQLMLAISYEDGASPAENNDTGVVAIDMGEIHGIAAFTDKGQALIITSRKLRSVKRLRNKKHGELEKKLSKCTEGSRRWRKLKRAKAKISQKTERQQKDILHKTSFNFAKWAKENQIKKVVIGNVEGIQRNTSRKKKNPKNKQRNRISNQKMSQWSFGQLKEYLSYKLKAMGIEIILIDESYTTQTCPVCDRRSKVSGRTYRCQCGYIEHRDIHGARNILSKYLSGTIKDLGIKTAKVKYLRPAA